MISKAVEKTLLWHLCQNIVRKHSTIFQIKSKEPLKVSKQLRKI